MSAFLFVSDATINSLKALVNAGIKKRLKKVFLKVENKNININPVSGIGFFYRS